VPGDFHVWAGGSEQGSQRRGESVVHRFQTLGAEFPPYLIAGRYQERRVDTGHGAAIFWTRDSLDEMTARAAAERLTATFVTYQNLFGPVMRDPFPIHIVETSAELAPVAVVTPNISATSFPGGMLLDRRAVALGLARDAVLEMADYELARTWFGWHVRPRAEVDLLLGRGMALFAAVHAEEARQGGTAIRGQHIAQLLATYDGLGAAAAQKPGFGPLVGYTRAQVSANSYKGALFLFTLEDVAGEEKLHRAVRRVLAAMAGQEIGSDEFRSAIEAESGRNLADVFHAWSDRPGIPPEFRARYAAVQ